MTAYLDTSFLLKLYVYEPDSAVALQEFTKLSHPLISKLTDVEVASALFRKLPAHLAAQPYATYQRDRAQSLYRELLLGPPVYQVAQQLAETYSGALGLRSLDALHLATALHYNVKQLGTFDRGLRRAAERLVCPQLLHDPNPVHHKTVMASITPPPAIVSSGDFPRPCSGLRP